MNRIARFTFIVLLVVTLVACVPSPGSPTLTPKPSSTTKLLPSPTLLPGDTAPPAWLPAGIIAFARIEERQDDIYIVHTDGTGLARLADGPGLWLEHPTWSPDGTRIAYHSGFADWNTFTLWAINADGTEQVQLTHLPPSAYWPAWSPDGTQIAFTALSSNRTHFIIYLMNTKGSNLIPLTSGEADDIFASWAPNGTILFLREPTDNTGDVFAINPDGTGLAQLTTVGHIGGYAVSPDGMKIALHDTENHRIEVIPTDTSATPVTLVDNDFGCRYVAMSWSPDGQALAMACSSYASSTDSDLYIVKASGSDLFTVPNTGRAYDPAWRPK
jgi:Tol biopolymer transport system component